MQIVMASFRPDGGQMFNLTNVKKHYIIDHRLHVEMNEGKSTVIPMERVLYYTISGKE